MLRYLYCQRRRLLFAGFFGRLGLASRPDEQSNNVTLASCTSLMRVRTALMQWFDDSIGDKADFLRARHHGWRDWSVTGRFRRRVRKFT